MNDAGSQDAPKTSQAYHSNRQRAKVFAWWFCVVLWAGFIFFMSAHTGEDLDDGSSFFGWIKQRLTFFAETLFGPGTDIVSVVAHFLEYTIFGALLTAAIAHTYRYMQAKRCEGTFPHRSIPLGLIIVLAIALASLYGATDEFHQSFIPERMADPADWLTDTLGASLGTLLAAWILHRK